MQDWLAEEFNNYSEVNNDLNKIVTDFIQAEPFVSHDVLYYEYTRGACRALYKKVREFIKKYKEDDILEYYYLILDNITSEITANLEWCEKREKFAIIRYIRDAFEVCMGEPIRS